MEIKKPWIFGSRINELEGKIIEISQEVEYHFIDLARNAREYPNQYLYSRFSDLHNSLWSCFDLTDKLSACYLFNSNFSYAESEATTSRANLAREYIRNELNFRRKIKSCNRES